MNSLFAIVMLYKVMANDELANTESLPLGQVPSYHLMIPKLSHFSTLSIDSSCTTDATLALFEHCMHRSTNFIFLFLIYPAADSLT